MNFRSLGEPYHLLPKANLPRSSKDDSPPDLKTIHVFVRLSRSIHTIIYMEVT
jgi:hypothetical protein